MLLSRKNQLLLEFSFWNEPVPRDGPNIYELRSYQLRVSLNFISFVIFEALCCPKTFRGVFMANRACLTKSASYQS